MFPHIIYIYFYTQANWKGFFVCLFSPFVGCSSICRVFNIPKGLPPSAVVLSILPSNSPIRVYSSLIYRVTVRFRAPAVAPTHFAHRGLRSQHASGESSPPGPPRGDEKTHARHHARCKGGPSLKGKARQPSESYLLGQELPPQFLPLSNLLQAAVHPPRTDSGAKEAASRRRLLKTSLPAAFLPALATEELASTSQPIRNVK